MISLSYKLKKNYQVKPSINHNVEFGNRRSLRGGETEGNSSSQRTAVENGDGGFYTDRAMLNPNFGS